ncbi:ELWxxDGT repeat protein [Fulvivirga lutimaris]|uniref:ELWxxDGT repeat protein n=1 Tax=Fulvivirga lutimaris TaxID=1819566 RepID=UPI0012BC6305|nr:ELWxxDGT repeat protein [Fulvivirga lutimaris]MTI39627.1 T9SS type A sorting domain-containing protein [Fulvivirga lutimaris]
MKKITHTLLIMLLFGLFYFQAKAQIELVEDLSPGTIPTFLGVGNNMVAMGNEVFFILDDVHPDYGSELWKADENGNISLVKDINPGNRDGVLNEEFIVFNNKLYFFGLNEESGFSLYETDGTEEGTILVGTMYTEVNEYYSGRGFTLFGDKLVFDVYNANEDVYDIWITDGTQSGTQVLKQTYGLNEAFALGQNILLSIEDIESDIGTELWISDGTPEGTELLKDIYEGSSSSSPSHFTNVNETIYFRAYTDALGRELWKTDGTTEGTVLIKDIFSGTTGSEPDYFTEFNGELFFKAKGSDVEGTELWVSDGTEAGTTLLKNIRTTDNQSSFPNNLFVFNNELFFNASEESTGNELWKTDGTEIGTVIVKDINTGTGGKNTSNFSVFNEELYFGVYGLDETTNGIWKTDGTEVGTEKVIYNDIGADYLNIAPFNYPVLTDNKLFFTVANKSRLYLSDGSQDGTSEIDLNIDLGIDTHPQNFIETSNGFFFTGSVTTVDGNVGNLFFSNGSTITNLSEEAGFEVKTSNNNVSTDMAYTNGLLFFQGITDAEGSELWVSDGTIGGTYLVKDINTSRSSENFLAYNGKVYFAAGAPTTGAELWVSDGTELGTTLVKDIEPGTGHSYPQRLQLFNDKFIFAAVTSGEGYEMWISDGTEGGTQLVKDIESGTEWGLETIYGVFIDKVFFSADDNTGAGSEMWVSDGTEGGTMLLKDITDGGNTSFWSRSFGQAGDRFFFALNNGEIWTSDGTEIGTERLLSSELTEDISFLDLVGSINGKLIFTTREPLSGSSEETIYAYHLYYTEGTPETTGILANDIFADENPVSSVLDNKLYFSIGRGIHITDGTPEGTTYIENDSNSEMLMTNYSMVGGDKVYFVGDVTADSKHTIWQTGGTVETTRKIDNDGIDIEEDLFFYNNELYFPGYTSGKGEELYRFDPSFALQSISFDAIPDQFLADETLTLSASASSDLVVSYEIVSGPATVDGNEITFTGLGTVTVKANQAGDGAFHPAISVEQSFEVLVTDQSITFEALEDQLFSNGTLELSATTSSGLDVSYDIVSGPATVSGNVLTFTGLGTVTVKASQAGSSAFSAATPVEQSFEIIQTSQSITFDAIEDQLFSNGILTLGATASSGLEVTYEIISGPATVSGNVVTFTGLGEVVVSAAQAGNDAFAPATSVEQSFTIFKNEQTITFNTIDDQFFEAGSLNLSATASSGLEVSYAVVSGPATVSGNVVSFSDLGTVVVSANQAGDDAFLAATSVEQSFDIITVTGVDDVASALLIYPNPATDVLTIQTQQEDVSIQLLNMNGTQVMTIRANAPNSISHLNDGIYFLRISVGESYTTHKIIKK